MDQLVELQRPGRSALKKMQPRRLNDKMRMSNYQFLPFGISLSRKSKIKKGGIYVKHRDAMDIAQELWFSMTHKTGSRLKESRDDLPT